MFVSFEGIDGAGKSTQARMLAEALGWTPGSDRADPDADAGPGAAADADADPDAAAGPGAAADGTGALLLREPGGTAAGERLRELLKDPSLELAPRTELLLFLAARAELVERVIRPALEAGRDVVCDRFMDSTVAYQGVARGLGAELVAELGAIAVAGCVPDRTVLLRLPRAEAAARGAARGDFGSDRFEGEGEGFQETIAEAFERIAAAEPGRVTAVDATGAPQQVHARVLEALGVAA